MKVGFLQMTPVWGDVDTNLSQVESILGTVDADIIVLPEFFNTGYLFLEKNEIASLAEPIPEGKTTQKLKELSSARKMILAAGLPEKEGNKFYNSAVLVFPDGTVEKYRKIHLFHREKMFFEPGDLGFPIFKTQNIIIGIMICFDWIFPEAMRTLALKGADIILHPSNLVLPYCPKAMVTRCIENHVFAVTCNRSGIETRGDTTLKYIGNSRIIAPNGEVLAAAGTQESLIMVTEIDPLQARDKFITPDNHLFNDRREKLYFTE